MGQATLTDPSILEAELSLQKMLVMPLRILVKHCERMTLWHPQQEIVARLSATENFTVCSEVFNNVAHTSMHRIDVKKLSKTTRIAASGKRSHLHGSYW